MMQRTKQKSADILEQVAVKATHWVGSVSSLLIHTALFLASFVFYFFGVPIDRILLVVTTIVSFEAIYLSIFIQMTVNRQAEDIEDIQEDVEEIQEDVDEIQEDVDEIQEDVEEIQEEDEDEKKEDVTLNHIQILLSQLSEDVKELKDKHK